MSDTPETSATTDAETRLREIQAQAAEHTRLSIEHMARYGIQPEGRVGLFLPPSVRQSEIHRLPYEHEARQRVVYQTEPGEFSALCPFSGLPDSGTVRVEYVPGEWLLELKSLKYYLMSWRHVGAGSAGPIPSPRSRAGRSRRGPGSSRSREPAVGPDRPWG